MKLFSLILVVIASFGVLIGCGGGGGGSSESSFDPATTTRLFYQAWADHDVRRAMSYVSPDFSESGMDCYDLEAMLQDSPRWSMRNYETINVSYNGSEASVRCSMQVYVDGSSDYLEGMTYLRQRGGVWKICGYNGRDPNTPLTITKIRQLK